MSARSASRVRTGDRREHGAALDVAQDYPNHGDGFGGAVVAVSISVLVLPERWRRLLFAASEARR